MFHSKLLLIALSVFFSTFTIAQNKQNEVLPSILPTSSDSLKKVKVNSIIFHGNKKTKNYIVEREIPFKKDDSLIFQHLPALLKQARQQIYNTSLFNEVKVDSRMTSNNNIDIIIDVKERWYIYPIPQFKIVDRNFNEWFNTYHASLQRINYGVKFADFNLSGKKDQLRLYLLNGYSRNISVSYSAPFTDHLLSKAFVVSTGFSQSKEINYKLSYNNKILWYPADSLKKTNTSFVSKNFFFNAGYSIRKGFFTKHIFNAGYYFYKVTDTIPKLTYNPNYFNNGSSSVGYIDLFYMLQFINVDRVGYPLAGRTSFISFLKRGLSFSGGINAFIIEGGYNRYFSLEKKWYVSIQTSAKLKLPFSQAYINQHALGYGDSYLRGLEYYVIDGVAAGLIKTTIKKKIIDFRIATPFKSRTHPYIPFAFYAKIFSDEGYAYNKKEYDAYLNNRLLYTGGFGIDIVTLYDFNIRLEYSFNQLKENGVFLHTQGGF